MLATRRYAQWRSRFLRYIDTRPNGDALRKCILEGPYTPSTVIIPVVPATENSPAVPERTTMKYTQPLMHARQLMKCGKLLKGYNKFLQQLQPEWLRFVIIIKQLHKLDEVSYHKLFDILKQYQKEVNEIRAERIAKNANPLALKIDNQTEQFGNQRTMTVAGAKETVGGSQKGLKTPRITRKRLCKQAEKGVQLHAEQSDWIADIDEEIDEQELEAHYSYMKKIQEVPTVDSGTDSEPLEQVQYDTGYNVFANERQHSEQSESISNTCVVETDDSNVTPDSPDMCDNDIQDDQNDVECDDECNTPL
ncbi:hypothetical protein Tco_0417780 [Tanacetum coccineum]